MKPEITGPNSKTQYSGTLKKTICTKCDIDLTDKSRIQQDEHEKNCKLQEKLF